MSTVLVLDDGYVQRALARSDYVALADGSVWDRETLWQEVERVLRDERHKRRRKPRGRPPGTGSGPGSGAGLTDEKVGDAWRRLEAWRLSGWGKCDQHTQALVDAAYPKGQHPREISRAAVARALFASRVVFWRFWDAKPWPPA